MFYLFAIKIKSANFVEITQQMKILAIYFKADSGISIFYERIIEELTHRCEVDVLCDKQPELPFETARNIYIHRFPQKQAGWYRRFLRWFRATPFSQMWSRKAYEIVAKDYDVVITFMATTQLTSVVCGKYISQQLGCKFAIYSVDAIPAPGGWTSKRSVFYGKKSGVARTFSAADYVAASNRHMLEYQLTTFKNKPTLVTDVLLTPSPAECYNNPPSEEPIFLYTGSLYGLRNPNHFLKAFKRLLKSHPSAQLVVVGMRKKLGKIDRILTPEERKRVVTAAHTSDLEPYFRRAKVLVDIDADLDKDPFLSSKIVTYLKVNRVILSETGRITPSREIFAGLNTVVQCDHNEESLYRGMLRAIEVADSEPDFSEREPLIKEFSIEVVSEKFYEGLLSICK